MWHWERITQEPYKGGWTHRYFVRGRKSLCNLMSRYCTPARKNTSVEGCSVEEHTSIGTKALDVPMRSRKVDMRYLPPSLPKTQPFTWVTDGSLDEFHTPAWEKLFDTFCKEDIEEHGQQQDGKNSVKIFYDRQNIDALYDSILPTEIVEPEFIIEPTPLKEDPKLHVANSFTEPLSMTEPFGLQTLSFNS